MHIKTIGKTVLILSFFLLQSSSSVLVGQEISLLVDTIYSKKFRLENGYLFINDQHADLVYKNGIVAPHPQDIQKFWKNNFQPNLIQIDNISYSSTSDLDYDPSLFIPLDLNTIYRGILQVSQSGQFITYQQGDSIFVANLRTQETEYVTKNNIIQSINERYIHLQKGFEEDHLIYDFISNKLTKLPDNIKIPNTDHPYFIVDNFSDTYIHVIDLKGKNVIAPAEGYDQYLTRGNLLVLYGNGKPVKVYHKDKLLSLNEPYVDMEYSPNSKVIFLKDAKGKFIVLDFDGKIMSENKFDEFVSNTSNLDHIILRKGNTTRLYTNDFELVLEGDFDNINPLSQDRFLISRNSTFELRDRDFELVNSLDYTNFIEAALFFDEFGVDLFGVFYSRFSSNTIYSNSGELLAEWKDEKDDEFYTSSQFTKGYNVRMIRSLSKEQVDKINPTGIWIYKTKDARNRNVYYACDTQGNRLSPDYKLMQVLSDPNHFLVKTLSSNTYGILKLKK